MGKPGCFCYEPCIQMDIIFATLIKDARIKINLAILIAPFFQRIHIICCFDRPTPSPYGKGKILSRVLLSCGDSGRFFVEQAHQVFFEIYLFLQNFSFHANLQIFLEMIFVLLRFDLFWMLEPSVITLWFELLARSRIGKDGS